MRRVIGLLALTPLLLAGCYTVLRHPRVEPSETPEPALEAEGVGVRSDCTACHSDWDLAMFQYAFQPGWYPVYGPWPEWYAAPWWVDVVVAPHPDGTRTQQGRGLANDRLPPSGLVPTGVWAPGAAPVPSGGAVTVPGGGARPGSSSPPASGAEPDLGGRSGSNPSTSAPRTGEPATRPAPSGGEPRPAEPANEPKTTPGSREAAPSPSPKQDESKPTDAPRGDESQGQGMTNDRRGPKP